MKRAKILLITLLLIFIPTSTLYAADVWEVTFKGEVTPSQVTWLEKVYDEASIDGIETILMVLDTPGGRIDSALKIAQIMQSLDTVVLVDGGAISAGAYIALSADQYFMLEGTTIGAAEPRVGLEVADEKTVSYWSGQLATMAEKNNRDPLYARAMADKDVVIKGISEAGKLLTLTAREAKKLEMTDGLYPDKASFLEAQDITIVRYVEKDMVVRLADTLSSAVVSTMLLIVGMAGIVMEMFIPGFGLPGVVGLSSLALYFGGSMLAGIGGWGAALLFIVGLLLIGVEVFIIPGFGVVGVSGLIAIFASIFATSPDPTSAVRTMVIVLLASIALIVLLVRFLPTKHKFSKIVLRKGTDTESGYISFSEDLKQWKDKRGVAYTSLRPSGTARIDETFVDVITQGEFIDAGTPLIVKDVVGGRVIVEKQKKETL